MKSKPWLRAGAATSMISLSCLGAAWQPTPASAFCGFYVAGADSKLYANATMVVLMREGTKTVLSMQNNYEGPPEEFAMVVPVPTVLTKDQVKVLPHEVFEHVDVLGAPRLVEYWETDPCSPRIFPGPLMVAGGAPTATAASDASLGVTVEATFAVGEYDVVVLSADDSTGLNTWLRDNQYNIPDGAAPILEPYVAAGTKFFVAKVDPARVTFEGRRAVLSPLRFHYDSMDFALPVRLGLLNSQGTQDLIVNILARDRYELANYPNVTIPTNLRVHNEVRDGFGAFYESLFSEVTEKHPATVVTEYSWDASSCDPCPTPPLSPSDLATLGADVTQQLDGNSNDFSFFQPYTLTRLHYRYTSQTLGEDLVFAQAKPITGGRGVPDPKGKLEQTDASAASINNFQGRYIILHPWNKQIACQNPQRGQWGGPDGVNQPSTQGSKNQALSGTAPAAADLPQLVAQSVPELQVEPLLPLGPFDVRSGPLPQRAEAAEETPGDNSSGQADPDGVDTDGEPASNAGTMSGTATPGNDSAGDAAQTPTVTNPSVERADSEVADTGSDGAGSDSAGGDGCSCRVGTGARPAPITGFTVLTGLIALWSRRRRARS